MIVLYSQYYCCKTVLQQQAVVPQQSWHFTKITSSITVELSFADIARQLLITDRTL